MKKNDFVKLKPMLLEEVSKPFNSQDYIYELKFDGIRCMIFIKNNEIVIKSRNGVILNEKYPELLFIKNLTNETCVFDGEIVLLENCKPSFTKVMERFKLKDKLKIKQLKEDSPVSFVAFDILYKNKSLINLPLIERKRILGSFNDSKVFIKSKYIEEDGKGLFNVVKEQELEGIVAKRKDSKYFYNKRTSEWVKIKNYIQEEFFICGYDFNKNNTIGVLLGEKINKDFYYVGKVIMGDKHPLYFKILNSEVVKRYIKNYNEKNSKFIKAKYKVKINYIERTKDNMLREAFIKKQKY